MTYIGLLFPALMGVGMVAAWIGWSSPTSPKVQAKAVAKELAPRVNGWTGKPLPPRRWTSSTGLRIQRRGFGSHLAGQPVRRRVWSPFAYSGMWSELHR